MGWTKPVILLGAASVARKYCTVRKLKRFVPIANWLPNYKLSFVKNDFIAGLTVGLTLVPQALAFAQVANLPPEYGLYSSFVGLYVYTLLGTSKDAGLGPTNLLSMLVGQIMLGLNSPNPIYTTLMSFFCGLTLMVMGFLQLGFLVNMFSIPVISGFTSAAGLIIIVNQLGNLFGISNHGVTPYEQLSHFVHHFTKMNFADLFVGTIGLVFLIIMQRIPNFARRRFPTFNPDSRSAEVLHVFCASRNVILVVIGTLFSFTMKYLHPEMNLSRVGQLPSGLPVPTLPRFSITNESRFSNETGPSVVVRSASQVIFQDLGMSLIVVPLMTMLELFAITKALGRKNHYRVDHSQELIAVGLANVAGSFFHAFPISAAVTRSALNDQCRVSTPLAGSLSAVVVIIAVLFAMLVFYFIPKSILAAIIISAGIALMDLATVARVWHEWRWDLIPLAATFFVSLFLNLWQGILVGISISLAMLLAPVVRLKIVTEHLSSTSSPFQPPQKNGDCNATTPAKPSSSAKGTPFQTPPSLDLETQAQKEPHNAQPSVQRVIIVRLQQGLQFPSVDRFTDRMSKIIAKDVGQIVIDCQFITGLDFTSLQGIRHVLLLAYRLNRSVVFARLTDHLRKHIELLDIDHFRHVSRWDDILTEDQSDVVSADWYGTRVSLNGSAFGENNVDGMLAKRTVCKNLEDLTPIPEENSEQSIDAVIAIPNGGSPKPTAPHTAPVPRPKSDHALVLAAGQLAYEPHFFGSAIPLAVGSVSLEDVTSGTHQRPKEPVLGNGHSGEPVENFLRSARYVISGDESDSESSSDSDDGITVIAGPGSARKCFPIQEHVELLEFTRKPFKHGHAASGDLHENGNVGGNGGPRLSFRTPGGSDSNKKAPQGLVATSSYPHLKLESEGGANGESWPADVLVSNLARSLSHQETDKDEEAERDGLQMVTFLSATKKPQGESSGPASSKNAGTASDHGSTNAGFSSPTVVIVHSSTSDETASTRDKLD